MVAYDEARFGKHAATDNRSALSRLVDYFAMSKLTPENRKLRDTIEDSIREEQRLRDQAKDEVVYAKQRLSGPPEKGKLGWLTDVVRSMIPGLAPVATPKSDGMTKLALEEDEPSTAGTLAHTLSALLGAGAGAGIQHGSFGGLRGAAEAARVVPAAPQMAKDIVGRLGTVAGTGKSREALARKLQEIDPATLMQLTQRERPLLTRLSNFFARPAGRPATRGAATKEVSKVLGPAKKQLMQKLPDVLTQLSSTWRHGLEQAGKTIPAAGWRIGAGAGALAMSLPFIISNIVRARKVREQGGPAATSARGRATELMQRAEELQKARQAQLVKSPA
jgi:hypothetical protein